MTAAGGGLPADLSGVPVRDVFGEALVELGARDPRVVVLDGDLGNSTKIDRFAAEHPDRFYQMGIAEQNMAGVAAGMALSGLVPFMVTFAAFAAFRDLDQIRVSIAQTKAHVVIVGSYAGLLASRSGKTHVCMEDVALLRALPNMSVLAPGTPGEMRQAVALAATLDGPVYLRVAPVALVSSGFQLGRTVAAAGLLAAAGIEALVLHVPFVKPLDADAVLAAARRTGAVVTTEDHSVIGGLGSAVAELLGERHPTPLRRVGTQDVYVESAPNEDLVVRHGLTAERVAEVARELIGR